MPPLGKSTHMIETIRIHLTLPLPFVSERKGVRLRYWGGLSIRVWDGTVLYTSGLPVQGLYNIPPRSSEQRVSWKTTGPIYVQRSIATLRFPRMAGFLLAILSKGGITYNPFIFDGSDVRGFGIPAEARKDVSRTGP